MAGASKGRLRQKNQNDQILLQYQAKLTCKRLDHSLQLLAAFVDARDQIHDQQHQYMLQQPPTRMGVLDANSHLPGENMKLDL